MLFRSFLYFYIENLLKTLYNKGVNRDSMIYAGRNK